MMRSIAFALALGLATVASAAPKQPPISLADARKTALARVGGGTVKSGELEREHGRLIYSFDIATGNHEIIEVNIDARTGAVVAVEHESAEQEKAEHQRQEAERQRPRP